MMGSAYRNRSRLRLYLATITTGLMCFDGISAQSVPNLGVRFADPVGFGELITLRVIGEATLPRPDEVVRITAELSTSMFQNHGVDPFVVPSEYHEPILKMFEGFVVDPEITFSWHELGTIKIDTATGYTLHITWYWTGTGPLCFSFTGFIWRGKPVAPNRLEYIVLDDLIREARAKVDSIERQVGNSSSRSVSTRHRRIGRLRKW